jgi:hypothetical protein
MTYVESPGPNQIGHRGQDIDAHMIAFLHLVGQAREPIEPKLGAAGMTLAS